MIYSKGKTSNQGYSTQQSYHSELKEREFFREAKAKGVHHHLTGFIRIVKWTCLG